MNRYLGWCWRAQKLTTLNLELTLNQELLEQFIVTYLLEGRELDPKTICSYVSAVINVVCPISCAVAYLFND